MDAEEIQVERPEGDQRMNRSRRSHLLPALHQFGHEVRSFGSAHRAEAHLAPAARVDLDDVVFGLLVLAGVAISGPMTRSKHVRLRLIHYGSSDRPTSLAARRSSPNPTPFSLCCP